MRGDRGEQGEGLGEEKGEQWAKLTSPQSGDSSYVVEEVVAEPYVGPSSFVGLTRGEVRVSRKEINGSERE